MRLAPWITVLVALLALPSVGWAQAALSEIRTIVIDAGHGGEDHGAEGLAAAAEKERTLQVALALRDALLELDPTLRIVMTREDDSYPTLDERTHLANVEDADLLLSLHFNAALNPGAEGIETFFLAPEGTAPGEPVPGRLDDGPATPHCGVEVAGAVGRVVVDDLRRDAATRRSALLAESVQASLLRATGARDRGVRQAQFRVLRGVFMPAVVVELGFLTHEDEAQRIDDETYRAALVDGLVEAVIDFDTTSAAMAAEVRPSDVRVAGR